MSHEIKNALYSCSCDTVGHYYGAEYQDRYCGVVVLGCEHVSNRSHLSDITLRFCSGILCWAIKEKTLEGRDETRAVLFHIVYHFHFIA